MEQIARDLACARSAARLFERLAVEATARAHVASLAHVLSSWAAAPAGCARAAAAEGCVLALAEAAALCGAIDVVSAVAVSAAARRAAAVGSLPVAGAPVEWAAGGHGAEGRVAEDRVVRLVRTLWEADAPPARLADDAPVWLAERARGTALTVALALHTPATFAAEQAALLLVPPSVDPTAGVAFARTKRVAFDAPLARLIASASCASGPPLVARVSASAHWPALSAALAGLGPQAPPVRLAVRALVRVARPALAGELLLHAHGVHPALRGAAPALCVLRAYLESCQVRG